MFDVGGWLFLYFCFLASPVFAQTNELPTLVPAYAEIPPTFWEQHKLAIIIGGFLFISAQSLILWKLLMRLQPAVEPPENLARAALNELAEEPEEGKLLSAVSQIVRCYFSVAYELPANEMTTTEFCVAMTAHEKIGTELAQKVSALLRVCDHDKFAPKVGAPPINAVDRASELISLSEKRRAQIAAANSPKR